MKKRPIYRVFINLRHVTTVFSAEAAWRAIAEAPFGSGYRVLDRDGHWWPEFIPF